MHAKNRRAVAAFPSLLLVTVLATVRVPLGAQGECEEALATLAEHGVGLDAELLLDLDKNQAAAALMRVAEVVELARGLDGARAARRERFVLVNHRSDREHFDPSYQRSPPRLYPMAAAATRKAGSEPLPLILAPSPAALRAAGEGASASLEDLERSARPWVSALHFSPPDRPGEPFVFPCATPAPDLQGPVTNPHLKTFVDTRRLGVIAGQAKRLVSARRALRREGVDVGRRVDVVAVAPSLFLVRAGDRTTVGVPIADANGAARRDRAAVDSRRGSWFRNAVVNAVLPGASAFPPTVVFRPLPVGAEEMAITERPRSEWRDYRVQERVLVTAEMLEATPIVVWKKLPSWRPFMEDIELVRGPSRPALPDGTLGVLVRADIEAKALMNLVGAYFGVDLTSTAAGQEWLARQPR